MPSAMKLLRIMRDLINLAIGPKLPASQKSRFETRGSRLASIRFDSKQPICEPTAPLTATPEILCLSPRRKLCASFSSTRWSTAFVRFAGDCDDKFAPKPVQKARDPFRRSRQLSRTVDPKPPALSPVGGQPATPVPPKPPSIPGIVPPAANPASAAGPGAGSSPPPSAAGNTRKRVNPETPAVANVPPPPATARPASLAGAAPLAPKPPGLTIPSATIPPLQLRLLRLSSEPKETAKVPPSAAGSRPLPQASVHLQKKPGASVAAVPASKSASTSSCTRGASSSS